MRRPFFHFLSLLALVLWGMNIGIDVARFSHYWGYLIPDIAVVSILLWFEMKVAKETP
jgi:hypothetical protein